MTDLPSGIWQNPDILNSRPCITGTRIPTETIWSFFRAAFTTTEIIGQYPTLTAQEVEGAIRFERARRMKRWRVG